MFAFIKKLFGTKPAEVAAPAVDTKVEAANSAPYKVETPTEVAVKAVIEASVPAEKKPAPKKQQFAKKAPAAKKPAAAKKAPAAKKPAAPKAKPAK
jgi:hypothetical protein